MKFVRSTKARPEAEHVGRDGGAENVRDWQERAELLASELQGLREGAAFEDPATGLGNQRQFVRDATKLAARFRRRLAPFSIVLLDIRVARESQSPLPVHLTTEVAERLIATSREEDGVFLLNSALFAILVADTSLHGAERLLDRIRFALTTTPLQSEDGPSYVTVAGGLAEASSDHASVDEMVVAARKDLTRYGADLGRQHAWFRPNAA